MARASLASEVADALLDRIIAGEFQPGHVVPGELELCAHHEVSRMTVREAMKTLAANRILRVERGRGTFVNPINEWASLEDVLRFASAGHPDAHVAAQLIELRRMLETGACELAATRITAHELAALGEHVATMRTAHHAADLKEFVRADLAFHDIIMKAAGNIFVGVLFEPLHRVLETRRAQTSAVPEIQAHAIEHHAAIVTALEARDPHAARDAMAAHMQQTLDDLHTYVLK